MAGEVHGRQTLVKARHIVFQLAWNGPDKMPTVQKAPQPRHPESGRSKLLRPKPSTSNEGVLVLRPYSPP